MSQDTPVIVGYIMTLFLFMALFVFFLFHMSVSWSACMSKTVSFLMSIVCGVCVCGQLAFGSLTTIELREKRNSDSKGVQHRWAVVSC